MAWCHPEGGLNIEQQAATTRGLGLSGSPDHNQVLVQPHSRRLLQTILHGVFVHPRMRTNCRTCRRITSELDKPVKLSYVLTTQAR